MYREKLMETNRNAVAGLYPITKLYILCMYIVWIILANLINIRELPLLTILLSFCIPVFFAISGAFKTYVEFMKHAFILVLFIFVVQAFIIKGSDPVLLWQWKFLHIYLAGLDKGITLSFNILNFAGIFFWFFNTTGYQRISTAFQQNGLNHKVAYIFLSTFNMIDILGQNAGKIMDAQRARGVETEGNVFVRMKAFIPVIVPLVVNALLEVSERTMTLESKAFSVKCKKTIMIPVCKNGHETKALVIMGLITVILIGGTVVWLTR